MVHIKWASKVGTSEEQESALVVKKTYNIRKIKRILDETFEEPWRWLDVIITVMLPTYTWYQVGDEAVCCIEHHCLRDHIAMLGVTPKYQRKGYGGLLMQETFSGARKRGVKATLMVRESNPAREIYKHYGFAEKMKVEGYYRNGELGYYCEVLLTE